LSAIAIDNDLPITVIVAVAIMAALDHNGIVTIAIPILTLAYNPAVPITVAMTGTNRHARATRTDTNADADFFGTRRHCNRNCGHRDGSHYKTLDHRMLLSMKLPGKQFAGM
jgi:hypothetical protein